MRRNQALPWALGQRHNRPAKEETRPSITDGEVDVMREIRRHRCQNQNVPIAATTSFLEFTLVLSLGAAYCRAKLSRMCCRNCSMLTQGCSAQRPLHHRVRRVFLSVPRNRTTYEGVPGIVFLAVDHRPSSFNFFFENAPGSHFL